MERKREENRQPTVSLLYERSSRAYVCCFQAHVCAVLYRLLSSLLIRAVLSLASVRLYVRESAYVNIGFSRGKERTLLTRMRENETIIMRQRYI